MGKEGVIAISTINKSGTIKIPKAVRNYLGLEKGDIIEWRTDMPEPYERVYFVIVTKVKQGDAVG